MSDWLELELAGELRPVAAPDGLWGRVQAARVDGRPAVHRRFAPAMVAVLTLLVAAGAVWQGRSAVDLARLATRELHNAARLDLRSADAAEIRAWLWRETGMDVALPVSARVRLLGARKIRERGKTIGEVTYTVGDDAATLLVSRAGDVARAPSKHGGLCWRSQDQIYAVACSNPDQPQAACVLCHANL